MEDCRCLCGKIVVQIEQDAIVIKCRHCKRYLIFRTAGLEKNTEGNIMVTFKSDRSELFPAVEGE